MSDLSLKNRLKSMALSGFNPIGGEALEEIERLEQELENAKNTLYKLKCECEKCGNVWTESIYPVRAE